METAVSRQTQPPVDPTLAALRRSLGIDDLVAEVRALRESLGSAATGPEWFTLRAACERKGCTYNTAKSNPALQPGGGKPDGSIGGRRVWHRSTVEAWLKAVDRE